MNHERDPDGHINNCAIACGRPESECQMCLGVCPDRARFGMPNGVRPEIKALVERGDLTREEIAGLRCNSWEWEALVPAMNDEAFIFHVEHALKNCSTTRRPSSTYDDSIIGLHAPELLKRFKRLIGETDALAGAVGDLLTPQVDNERTIYELNCRVVELKRERDEQKDRAISYKRSADEFAATVDAVREALGQKETHYLVIADDVKALVEAVSECEGDGGCRASKVLQKIQAEPGSGTPKSPTSGASAGSSQPTSNVAANAVGSGGDEAQSPQRDRPGETGASDREMMGEDEWQRRMAEVVKKIESIAATRTASVRARVK